jgi:hypothetical protein
MALVTFFFSSTKFEVFAVVLGTTASCGLIFLLMWLANKISVTKRVIERVVLGMYGVACVVGICFGFRFLVYMPIAELMKLGYALFGAIALYVGILALLPVPLYCLGGKKLLLGTKLGEKICPIVHS